MSTFANLAVSRSTTGGTGNLELDSTAPRSFQSLFSAVGANASFYYSIQSKVAAEWEVGLGKITAGSPNVLVRTLVIESSNSDAAVNFQAGKKLIGLVSAANILAAGYLFKSPVVAVATSNVTLSSALENGDTLDGVTLATGNRVLLTAQSTASQNGIWVVAASGAPSRPSDFYTGTSARGAFVPVLGGTVGAGRVYVCTSASGSDVVGTNSLTWSVVSGTPDASVVTYTPAVLTDWDGDADPGHVDDALDQLAERVDDLEGLSTTIVDWKDSCRAATTANITLSGEQTIDGVSVVAGNRVLVKDQSTASQNGIYVAAAGSWSRSTDADANAEVTSGLAVTISEGSTNADKIFILTTNDPITVGSTSLTFSALSAGGGSGDVTGPVSSIDNAIPRFDGTGGDTLQNSGITIDDNDKMTVKAVQDTVTTLTDGSTVTIDFNTGNWQQVTLGGARALAASNAANGRKAYLRVVQDGTGGRTFSSWFSGGTVTYKTARGTAPILQAAAGAADDFMIVCRGSTTFDIYHLNAPAGLVVAASQTSSFSVAAGYEYPIDLSGGTDVTATFPGSPVEGDEFGLRITDTHASAECLMGRNSLSLDYGTSTDRYTIYQVGEWLRFTYRDSTWVLTGDGRKAGQFFVYLATTVSAHFASNAYTKVPFDTIVDNNGAIVSLANDNITRRRGAAWRIEGCATIDGVTDQDSVAIQVVSATDVLGGDLAMTSVSGTGTARISMAVTTPFAAAGTEIRVDAYQNSGSALSAIGAAIGSIAPTWMSGTEILARN